MFKANPNFLMCAIFTGNNLIKLDEVDSTNSYLSELASKEKLADGTVVIAQHQYAGKGQRGNIWETEKNKNLTFSILYHPGDVHLNKLFLLTQAISLGIYDYLITKSKEVKIKWPNDLYITNKKIGGLLIENTIKGDAIAQIIVGVGLNINQELFHQNGYKATSLKIENAGIYNLEIELETLLTCIERSYLQWKNNHFNTIKERYLSVLYLYQSWHIFQLPNGTYLDAKIIGVDELGNLLLEDLESNHLKFGNKEIIF